MPSRAGDGVDAFRGTLEMGREAAGCSSKWHCRVERSLSPPPLSLCRGIIKSGKVVVLLQGRYAGRKAVVVKAHEDGSSDRKFSHCIGKNVAC